MPLAAVNEPTEPSRDVWGSEGLAEDTVDRHGPMRRVSLLFLGAGTATGDRPHDPRDRNLEATKQPQLLAIQLMLASGFRALRGEKREPSRQEMISEIWEREREAERARERERKTETDRVHPRRVASGHLACPEGWRDERQP